MEILPFRAPALSPLEAHVFNLLCTRAQPWPIDVAGTPCVLEAGGLAAPVPPVCAFDVVCGERTWRVELGSLRLLALHPAVADVPPNAALPGALQLAVLDLLAAPLAELAQTFLHVPLAVRNVRMIEAAEPAVCALPLTLHVPVGAGASAEAYPIPVRLCLPDRESALELVERLDALPRRRALGLAGDVPVPVSLEAGRMRLSVNELSSLEPDDVLLPETYPAREGRVTLRLCATSRSLAFACSLAEGCATILSVLNPEEGPMSDENNTAAGAAPSEGVDTGELEVTLTFELERRLMTVRDVETLAPGYTFAFGGDALARADGARLLRVVVEGDKALAAVVAVHNADAVCGTQPLAARQSAAGKHAAEGALGQRHGNAGRHHNGVVRGDGHLAVAAQAGVEVITGGKRGAAGGNGRVGV